MPKPTAASHLAATDRVSLPSLDNVASQFGSTTWARGKQYAKQGAVLAANVLLDRSVSPPEFEIEAEVMGGDTDPYDQHIVLWTNAKGQWEVDGDCSCPVGFNCKHVVAVLAQVLEQDWFSDKEAPQEPPDLKSQHHAQWQAWLQGAEAEARKQHAMGPFAGQAAAAEPAEFAHFLVLDTCQSKFRPGQWLTLTQGKARLLKNKPGQLGKVVMPNAYATAYPGLITDHGHSQVASLYQRWHTGQQSSHYSWQPDSTHAGLPQQAIRDALGALVLEQAARAGELVTLTDERMVDKRVQWGPDLPLNWAWQAQGTAEDGSTLWALCPQLGDVSENAAAQLCMGEPLLYLDRTQGQCGHVLATQMALADVQRWLSLPPVSEQWIRQQSQRLSNLLPHLPETVQGRIVREVRGVKPVACLHIGKHPQPSAGVFLMRLHFDYDGVAGTWGPGSPERVQVTSPDGVVTLWRQLDEEFNALQTLLAQGYRPLHAQRFSEWQADDNHPAMRPHTRDLALLDLDFAPLREAGFRIDLDPWLLEQQQQQGELDMALLDGNVGQASDDEGSASHDWFSLSMGFTVGGQRINLLDCLPQLIERWQATAPATTPHEPHTEHAWITDPQGQVWRIPTAPLRPWMAALMELMQERGNRSPADHWQLDRFAALRLAAAQDAPHGSAPLMLSADHAQSLMGLVNALRHPDDLAEVPAPTGLQAELRPYQQQGLNWMQHLGQHHLGGILADDMGLGKTLQTIAHLLVDKQQGRLNHPALVVAPTSLVGNWQNELARFAPSLKVLILHGSARHGSFANIKDHDVAITTYPLLLRDEAMLTKTTWSVVVLDEAQAIKNARTRLATTVQALPARQRLCLTGTPMENHLGEVWSLFNFLMPGYLSTEPRFKQVFRTPIEKHGDTQRMALLRTRLAPFMLRRTKAAVATELPPKIETVAHIELPPAQANLYEVIRVATEAKIQAALESKGLARSQIAVLDALLKLRQVCCDPRLVPLEAAKQVKESAKINWLLDNLPAMIEEGRRVLLFSQFTSMLSLIEEALAPTGLTWAKLTGQSQKRDAIVARFTSGEVPLFLISLKAGGVGLNLPQADTVIHFDPWWNPAAEDQATDRAHRMGQQSTVFVHKLVAQGTLEERIVGMQARKAALAQGLHGGDQAGATRFTEEDLGWLLQPIGAADK